MRPSKLRLPERTETTTSFFSSIALEMSWGSGPELPMHVVHPYPTVWNLSFSRYVSSPDFLKYSVTTCEPGASDVFTHGFTLRPRSTAFFASSPAAIMTDGLEVLV